MVKDKEEASDYEGMTKEEEKALLDRLLEKRTIKVQGAQRSNEGAAVDCRQVINAVNREVSVLWYISQVTTMVFTCSIQSLD